MNCWKVTIRLREPLLATAPGSDPNTERSHDYIPGSVLRGALAQAYLRNGGDANGDEFTRLFLDGRTRFHNAYPVIRYYAKADNEHIPVQFTPTLPIPLNWRTEKDAPPQNALKVINLFDSDAPPSTRKLKGFCATVSIEPGQPTLVLTRNAAFEISVHNRRDRIAGRATADAGALFRYQALRRGQQFAGEIWASDEDDLELLRGLVAQSLLLGGSQSAGYGLAEISLESSPMNVYDGRSIAKDESFLLYLASDLIARDPLTGQPGAPIAGVLQDALGVANLELEQAVTQECWVGGFNAKWGLPLPQTWAYEKGSVFILKAGASIDGQKLMQLTVDGLGDRTAEGFGRVLFNPTWLQPGEKRLPSRKRERLTDGIETESQEARLTAPRKVARADLALKPVRNEVAATLLKQMNDRLAEQRLDRALQAAAQGKVNSRQTYVKALSPSQLGRLRLRIRQAYEADDTNLAAFESYLKGTEKRKSADDQFRRSRLDGKNFRKWMGELCDDPTQVWGELKLNAQGWSQRVQDDTAVWETFLLGKEPYRLDDRQARKYAARLIEAVCELLSRGGRS